MLSYYKEEGIDEMKKDFKERFFQGVVNHKKLIVCIFIFAIIICGICKQFVGVNYDLNDYLPEGTASSVSLEIMEEEFGSGVPNARVMISDITIPKALEIKEEILKVEGVSDVIWLDDELDITVPIETLDSKVVENYYKDQSALFSVTIDEDKSIEAVNSIRELIGDENAMTGTTVDNATATELTMKEISKIVIITICINLLVLILTTTSWVEPIILLLSIGVAIILNEGSNIIFGEISFVTNSAGNMLQLAISLDYSVFLLHRFREFREAGLESEEAMVKALCISKSSILSSGLTTVIGFLALTIMKFQIGPDMGFALAKGITFSLITVFIFTPVIIMYSYKLIEKTTHPSFMPSFYGFGKLISKVMIPMSILFIVIIMPSYLASTSNSYYYGAAHIFNEETKVGQDVKSIEDIFGKSNNYVVMVPKGQFATEIKLSNDIKDIPKVSSIISYVDMVGAEIPTEYVGDEIVSKLISDNYSRMIITVNTESEGKEAFEVVEKIREISNKYYGNTYHLVGASVSTYDLMETVTSDMIGVNLLAIFAVFAILLFFMKSISLPFILVLAIETAVWLNLSIPYYMDTPLFYIGYLIISTIQLGATVDYAILLTDRYMEYRKEINKKEAVIKTIESVTISILTSGIIMTTMGFLLGGMSSNGVLSQLGYLLGNGTLCSLVIVLFVLPGLLYSLDKIIQKTTKGKVFINEKE